MKGHVAWWTALAVGLVLQTTLLPYALPDPWRPDFTRALVLWVALTGVPRGGPLLAFAAGLALDAGSGAPLGFGVALRLGLYGLARPLRGVFFDDHPALLLPLALLGAAADGALAWLASQLVLPTSIPFSALAALSWRQALGDVVAVPALFLALELASGLRPTRTLAP